MSVFHAWIGIHVQLTVNDSVGGNTAAGLVFWLGVFDSLVKRESKRSSCLDCMRFLDAY